jgi:hypothetical protein
MSPLALYYGRGETNTSSSRSINTPVFVLTIYFSLVYSRFSSDGSHHELPRLKSRYPSFPDLLFAFYPAFSTPIHSLSYLGFINSASNPARAVSSSPPKLTRSANPFQKPITITWTYSARENVRHCLHVVLTTIRSS